MPDPLSQVIELLRPRAVYAKAISGAGRWGVRYSDFGQPGFCAMIEGQCRLAVDGEPPVLLEKGDFVLLPATPAFTMSGLEPVTPQRVDPKSVATATADVRYGRQDGPPDMRQFGGYFAFGSSDAALLVSLLPKMIHIRNAPRLETLVLLLGEEASASQIGRSLILERLVEILLVEALRAWPGDGASSGLLRGLADARVSIALRRMHDDTAHGWNVADLARESGMSRSAFFERFSRTVGVSPMEYLLTWRMAVARNLLRNGADTLDEVARRIGYGSASTFSTAFSRHVGEPPGRYMRRSAAVTD